MQVDDIVAGKKKALCLLTGPTEHYFSLLHSSSLFLKEKEKEIEMYT